MSIKRTIITALVATATLVAVVAPMAASAQTMTAEQLMAEMAQLQAQLAQLQGTTSTSTTTTTSGNVPAACAGVTFTRNLTVGSTGQVVKCLQTILNANGFQVSATGAGSPGSETSYFGPATLRAVKTWQAAVGFVPANQIGPMSRAKLNAMLSGSTTTTTTGNLPQGCTSTSGWSPTTGQLCSGTTTTTTTTTTTNPTNPTGPVSAAVSSDTPAASSIVNGQASADLLHVNFTGSGTVTSVTLNRSGISDQNALTNVYLYDGNIRITDGYSFNVSGQLVINGLAIAVNGSHVISVRADVATATAPITESSIAVTMTSYSSSTTPTTANVMGNTMNIVAGNLATATIGTQTVATANVNAGTTQYTFWSAPLQVNTRTVLLKVANFRMIGSAPSDALSNIALYVDGTNTGKTATVTAINGSNYATFDLTSAPISLMTGSHTIDMRADVQKGTNRNITVSVQQASDLTVTDPQVGVNIAVGGTPNSGGQINILTGTVTVSTSPAFTAMTNVSGGATNSVIGQFRVHAYGEDVKVLSLSITPAMTTTGASAATAVQYAAGVAAGTTLVTVTDGGLGYIAVPVVTVTNVSCTTVPTATATISGGKVTAVTTSGGTCTAGQTFTVSVAAPTFGTVPGVGGLNNVTLYFNGSQIGSQQTWPIAGGALTWPSLGSQMVIPAGQDSTFEVRADLQTTSNVSYTAGTVGVVLNAGINNAQGQSSQNSANFPTAQVTTNTLSIQSGLLVVAANSGFLGQSIAPNTTGAKIGSYVIQNQSTSESVRLTSLNLTTTDSGSVGINNLSAMRTSDTTGSGSTPIQPTGTDNFSVNDTLAPGAQMTLDIFANTGSEASGTILTKLIVQSIGAVDNISTTSAQKTGQSMVLGTGTVGAPTVIASSTTQTQFIAAAGGATNATQATYNFVSSSGAATITELKFLITDGVSGNTVTNVCIGSMCAAPVAGTADLTGLQLAVPNGGGGYTANVQVSYTSVGTSGIPDNSASLITLTYVKYQSGGGSSLAIAPSVPAYTVYLVGSKPTLAINQGGASTGLIVSGATNKIGQVTVSADPKGNIKVNTLTFNVGASGFSSATVTSPFLVNGTSGSVAISSITCTVNGPYNQIVCATNGTQTNPTLYGNDYTISAGQSQTFSLYATVTGTVNTAATGGISTSLSAAGFKWDDTAMSGLGSATPGAVDNQLLGSNIYGFPSDSWSIHQ
jgi:DNA-binding protein YbaB